MSSKVASLHLSLPEGRELPDFTQYTPEENYFIITVGVECLKESKKAVLKMSQEEIYEKMEAKKREEIGKLELELLVERNSGKKIEDVLKKMYDNQVARLECRIEQLLKELETYESGNERKIREERDKYDLLLKEKDLQNQLNREAFQQQVFSLTKQKSMKEKGTDGEDEFFDMTETFKDFVGFKVANMAKQAHKGDFHLFFEDFNVLVDLKKYSVNVSKKEIDKIEMDLLRNDSMQYAWLISLDTDIYGWNRFPVMYKWIMSDVGPKCVFFVNRLLENKIPKNTLRLLWSICNEFHKLNSKVDKDDGALIKYRERDVILCNLVKGLQERSNEMRRNINVSSNILKQMNMELIEMMSHLTNEIMNNECDKYEKVAKWFDATLEYTGCENSKVSSMDIWTRFKREEKEYVGEKNLTVDNFKDCVKKLVESSKYIERTKKGTFDLIGFCFRGEGMAEQLPSPESKIENIVLSKGCEVSKKRGSKKEFDEELEKKVCNLYLDSKTDIMGISEVAHIRPWEVVSILVRQKKIKSRVEARGYDIYKDTDEYKSKIEFSKG